ncbi:alpha/beta fold hydrolase [Riemerella anatipestifer]|uniref:2-hydroxy-6-oxononadienedioate/2-hydroxy-6-oxononatrienedioate hydrolase n=1 Tax=Riemerella anatipestifer TaxID=34085 RepID=A0A1S7DRY7_RIEAN|nr:alpha/beta hydrolase [Riemerella anatipestifer]AQY21889.1 2-hydroxy-6-oxononadienedioate/2-hydroxy- 6-oxononatrienedioate hydrolase [Riemerella anatipestifer]MCO4304631.1 alpha/beta hydrolase [Riemerella anatipestifer]MCO7353416.1 alpha/beta hydrolase [Riemerella anatipestifer]MCQ4039938.1 alpha/beta hydrolase [Riemerella anatipestifer]MCT6761607.1 alpha/beta hydrolase [Riemerella anatipestifer]
MIFKTKKEKKFNFIEEGEGHPLVLLHGLMGGLSNFDDMVKFFSEKGYKVYVPELPIYDLPVLNTNLTAISKFVAKFIKEEVKEPVTIVGNSMGGHIGLILTLSKPELVKNLVLTGSSGLYEKSFGDSFPRKGDKEYIRKKTQEVFYDPAVATDQLVDEVFSVVNDRMRGIKTVMLARSAIKHNMIKDLPKITCPTCIIWGKQDNVTPPEVAVDMHKYIPNSDLYWIDKCGHAAMMEKPQEFNEILLSWLKKVNK